MFSTIKRVLQSVFISNELGEKYTIVIWRGRGSSGFGLGFQSMGRMNRLFEKGYILDPCGKAKSVVFTEEESE
jgi:hypothetical protein